VIFSINRPYRRAVVATALLRYGVSLSAAALLAGCGGSQPPLGVLPHGSTPQQSLAQQAYHIVHPFGRLKRDGATPSSDLIDINGTPLINVQGTLYSTTTEGGDGSGTVFGITTDGSEKIVHSFSGNDGRGPAAALRNVRGVLYGTTQAGGINNLGTVFRLTKSGEETVLHSFARERA
jgi:uncharacterized repeat protein (TIGR03803 family)